MTYDSLVGRLRDCEEALRKATHERSVACDWAAELAGNLRAAREENARLLGERKLGPTPHGCLNDDCGTISYGPGYKACPGCGGTEGRHDA
jgi:hypothetical protein